MDNRFLQQQALLALVRLPAGGQQRGSMLDTAYTRSREGSGNHAGR